MQAKTTRAFRTISEAGEELDLQPHVLRFWESKFSQIKPIKRGGGRRFYRPEDIEFLRGIKILLHDEGHPIKDVQKLIRLKGPARVMELGQSVEKAAKDKKVEDTVLVPKRIKKSSGKSSKKSAAKAESKMQSSSTGQSAIGSPGMTPDDDSVVIPPPIAHPAVVHPPVSQTEPVEPPVLDAEEEANYVVKQLEPAEPEISAQVLQQRQDLEEALVRLRALKTRWLDYKAKAS